jgi:hypothetical protein
MANVSIAQEDHPYVLEWLSKAKERGGGFLGSLAAAALVADPDNYPMMRPLVWMLYQKYPKYRPTPDVKTELAPIVAEWSRQQRAECSASQVEDV